MGTVAAQAPDYLLHPAEPKVRRRRSLARFYRIKHLLAE